MKYLPDNLRKAYQYDFLRTPNLPEIYSPLINVEDVLQAHYILADYFTDESGGAKAEKMLAGVRSPDLLCSAISRQIVSNGGKLKYTEPIHICATLFFGLTKDHPFHDGNKRTALLILLKQLTEYGFFPIQSVERFEELVKSVARGDIPQKYAHIYKKFKKWDDPVIETIAYILRQITEKKDRSIHADLNMKEFCSLLAEMHGVSYELDNMKIKFKRKAKGILKYKEFSYIVKFYGWTRPVEAGMARDTFDKLGLTDEFSTFNRLLAGGKSYYAIINQFELPLRRLKDK